MSEHGHPGGFDVDPNLNWKLPHTLTILATYKCTAACKECCFQSNPFITSRVPQERLLSYVDQAAELGTIRLVCFSGGESFLLKDDLVELVERCSMHGFMTRIVTNGYWATSNRAARGRLSPLVDAGLNEINFSTGDDHVEWVPIERVVRGLAESLTYGLGIALMVEARATRQVTRQTVIEAAKSFPELVSALENGRIQVVESPWMPFAPETDLIEQPTHALLNASNVHFREPCTSVLTTAVVTPSEQLGMCCGLSRESIADLHAGSLRNSRMKDLIEQTRYDLLKIWLSVEGPEKILAWAASKDPTIDWENKYAHNCDACRAMYLDPRVMRVIQDYFQEKYDEILSRYALFMAGKRPDSQL